MYMFDKQTEEKPTVGFSLLVERMRGNELLMALLHEYFENKEKFPSFPMVAKSSSF